MAFLNVGETLSPKELVVLDRKLGKQKIRVSLPSPAPYVVINPIKGKTNISRKFLVRSGADSTLINFFDSHYVEGRRKRGVTIKVPISTICRDLARWNVNLHSGIYWFAETVFSEWNYNIWCEYIIGQKRTNKQLCEEFLRILNSEQNIPPSKVY